VRRGRKGAYHSREGQQQDRSYQHEWNFRAHRPGMDAHDLAPSFRRSRSTTTDASGATVT